MNYTFIRSIAPLKVASKGILFFTIVYLITPAYIGIPLYTMPFVYIICCYLCFALGTIPLRAVSSETKILFSNILKKRILYTVWFFSLIGVVLRLVERLVIRGVAIGGEVFENRENLETSSSSLLGVISTILYPMVYFNLSWFFFTNQKNKFFFALTLLLFFFPTFDSFMIGSRSMILQNLFVLFLILFAFGKIKLNFKNTIFFLSSFFVILLFFMIILYNRLGGDEFSFDFDTIALLSDYNYTFPVKTEYLNTINRESNNFIKILMFSFVNFGQYVVHGIFEFNYLYTNYNFENLHSWGRSNLFLYYRIPDLFMKIDPQPSLFVREGVYSTFFGDVFVDFGWWGLVFMFFFGLISKSVYNAILNGNGLFLPLYFVLCYIIFFMLTINLLSGGLGLIVLHSLFVPYLIYRIFRYLIKFSKKKVVCRL